LRKRGNHYKNGDNDMKNLLTPLALILLLAALLTAVWAGRPTLLAQEQLSGVSSADSAICQNGMAGGYPCHNVNLLAFLSLDDLGGQAEGGANLWGWADPMTGKEYVLMALTDATVFIDISDPENPVILGSLPGSPSVAYRDVKVYADHAFIIADVPSEQGLQIFDLTGLRGIITTQTFTPTTHFDGLGNGHNLFINEETGYAYIARTTSPVLCSGALYVLNVQDLANPSEAGCVSDGGVASDTMCVVYQGPDAAYQGREICITSSDDDLLVHDVTDKAAPDHLATLTYPDWGRAHHGWFTADHHYFLSADMEDEHHYGLNTRIFLWDVSSVVTPTLMGWYTGPTTAGDHNVWTHGQYAYVGNFRAGLRILDMTAIAAAELTEAAYFDLYPANDNPGHEGAWAVYAYFESGVVAVSDKYEGLYLLRPTLDHTYLPVVLNPAVAP
jgi:choice-of-anchor B domain-containing protein